MLKSSLATFRQKEVLYDRARKSDFERHFGTRLCVYEMEDWVFTDLSARQKLLKHFGTKTLRVSV